jgi:predicted RNA-binding protein
MKRGRNMCLANIYQRGNGSKLIIKDVAYLKVDGNQVEVENLAGESKMLRAKINAIDFMNSDIFVDKLSPEYDGDSRINWDCP